MTPITDNNKKNPNSWADDLLVKDISGKFYTLKDGLKEQMANFASNVSRKTGSNTVVLDDSFSPIKASEGTADDSADFAFHPDDRDQIEAASHSLPVDDSKKYSINKIVDRLIEKQVLDFDEKNKKRFTDILYDFFRNRKKAIRVRELLTKEIKSGGQAISEDIIDDIMSVIKGIKNKIDTVGGLISRIDEPGGDLDKDEKSVATPALEKKETESKPASNFSLDYKDKEPEEETVNLPVTVGQKPKIQPEMTATSSLPKVSRPEQMSAAKKQITDVVKESKPSAKRPVLTGPVQELQDFNLETFRRLGNTAKEMTDQILDKINTLEKDSMTKKVQGIEAWRKSKVYKQYLGLGVESMAQNKEVASVISEHQRNGENTLTIDEFSAISDLNKLLRF